MKKEIKDEITHILYDQTRRTPIVIPVSNEIGGGGNGGGQNHQNHDNRNNRGSRPQGPRPEQTSGPENESLTPRESKVFPPPQVPDTEATIPRVKTDNRGY